MKKYIEKESSLFLSDIEFNNLVSKVDLSSAGLSDAVESQIMTIIRGEQAFFTSDYLSRLLMNEIKNRIQGIRNNHCS